MADTMGASAPGTAGRDAIKEAAGSLISIATLLVLTRTYRTQIRNGWNDVRGVATDFAHWARIQWGHNLVAFQRGMALWAVLLVTALHLIAMKIVSLEFNAIERPIPSGMWSLWGWLVGIVFVLYALGIARAFPVRPIEELTDDDRALTGDEFAEEFGPHNRSPFFLGLWFTGTTILSGFIFFVPYSWLGWAHGDGLMYRLCYIHAIWLPLLGLAVGVAIPFVVVKVIEALLGITVTGIGGWVGNQALNVFRGAATGFLPNVSGSDAEQKIKGDVAAELKQLGEGLTKAWTDLLALALVMGVWWMSGSFWLIPMTVAAGAVISAMTTMLRGKYKLGTLYVEQKRLLLNLAVLGPVFVVGVAFHGRDWLYGRWIALLAKFASMGTIVFLVLAGTAVALFTLALVLWAKQHKAFREEQRVALAKVPPEAIEKSPFMHASMVAALVLGLLLLGFGYSGYCLWTGDYTTEVASAVAAPTTPMTMVRSRRQGELEVEWQRIPGAVAYRAEVLKVKDGSLQKMYEASPRETKTVFTGLDPLQKYYVQVIAVGRLAESHPAKSAPIIVMATDLTPTPKKKGTSSASLGATAVYKYGDCCKLMDPEECCEFRSQCGTCK